MGFVARSRRKMWFGTEDYATWIPTPNSGADSSPQAWNETGTFLGGDGYAIGSRNSHKQYVYEWPSSSTREDAQLMKSFYEGAYGRGKLYFVEPLIYDTNVLPAKWANPAITCGFEGPSLVPGVDPVELTRADVVGGFFDLVGVQEPLTGALYNLTDVPGASATFTPVFENLFTNPRLKGDGTWAEVRRNYLPNASLLNTRTGWAWQSSSFMGTPSPDGLALETVSPVSSNFSVLYREANPQIPVNDGETWSARMWVENVGDVPVALRMALFVYGTGAFLSGNSVTIAPSESAQVAVEGQVMGAGYTAIRPTLRTGAALPAGARFRVRSALAEKAARVGPWFDGSYSPDPDMRSRWLGAENASESVMEIERVAGITGVNGIAGVSSWEGKPAVRIIPTATDGTGARARLAIPAEARDAGQWIGTVHRNSALAGVINSRWSALSVDEPPFTDPPVNSPGTESLRVAYSNLTHAFGAFLGHGGRLGSGDVWWTDIGLFSGDYDGPAFSGSDGSVTIDGIPYSTRWVGASDFSVSQAGIWTLDDNIILDDRNSVFIPIPEGMQLNIGANSREIGSDSPGIYLKPITDTPSNDIYMVGQASRSNLFPLVIPAKNGIRGVRMWIGKLGDSGNPSFVAVNFIHARLSPAGKPPTGPDHWIGGQGHAGTRFALPPTYISNTGVGGGQISYAATFKESLI